MRTLLRFSSKCATSRSQIRESHDFDTTNAPDNDRRAAKQLAVRAVVCVRLWRFDHEAPRTRAKVKKSVKPAAGLSLCHTRQKGSRSPAKSLSKSQRATSQI